MHHVVLTQALQGQQYFPCNDGDVSLLKPTSLHLRRIVLLGDTENAGHYAAFPTQEKGREMTEEWPTRSFGVRFPEYHVQD